MKRYVKWRCTKCKDEVISDKLSRHEMDFCKCKESALDAEEYYSRFLGYIEIIEESEYRN